MPKKVKAVTESLVHLFEALEKLAASHNYRTSRCQIQKIKWSVHASHVSSLHVVGRDDDKEAVVRFLLDKSDADQSGVRVIAIVGIAGIGKTTLAQLVYNDEHVVMNFKRRWWASISDVSNEKEILTRILGCTGNSINEKIRGLSFSDLYLAMKESINSHGKYLIVFDDLRDCNGSLLCKIMPFLRSGTIGSRIVITTTSMYAATSMGADQIHLLNGLTEEESRELFKLTTRLTPETDVAPERIHLPEQIVAMCDGVPLAIKAFASLFLTADKIIELEHLKNEKKLSDVVTYSLRLSYNQLASSLKPCLAYCSLFPKDYVFRTEELIYLWIGQGLVMQESDIRSAEYCGYEYFTELLSKFFFQDVTFSDSGKVVSCKMHGAIHDWVQSLVQYERCILTKQNSAIHKTTRHVSFGYEMDIVHGSFHHHYLSLTRHHLCVHFSPCMEVQSAHSSLMNCLPSLSSYLYLI